MEHDRIPGMQVRRKMGPNLLQIGLGANVGYATGLWRTVGKRDHWFVAHPHRTASCLMFLMFHVNSSSADFNRCWPDWGKCRCKNSDTTCVGQCIGMLLRMHRPLADRWRERSVVEPVFDRVGTSTNPLQDMSCYLVTLPPSLSKGRIRDPIRALPK